MSLINNLHNSFPNISVNNCLSHCNLTYFGITDDLVNRCQIVFTSNADFNVYNNIRSTINFLAIDKCVFSTQYLDERCDFGLFGDDYFTFVEIKKPFVPLNRLNSVYKAISQLESTIIEFKRNNIFTNMKIALEAIVCLAVPIQSYPRTTATFINRQVLFSMQHKAILHISRFKMYA